MMWYWYILACWFTCMCDFRGRRPFSTHLPTTSGSCGSELVSIHAMVGHLQLHGAYLHCWWLSPNVCNGCRSNSTKNRVCVYIYIIYTRCIYVLIHRKTQWGTYHFCTIHHTFLMFCAHFKTPCFAMLDASTAAADGQNSLPRVEPLETTWNSTEMDEHLKTCPVKSSFWRLNNNFWW